MHKKAYDPTPIQLQIQNKTKDWKLTVAFHEGSFQLGIVPSFRGWIIDVEIEHDAPTCALHPALARLSLCSLENVCRACTILAYLSGFRGNEVSELVRKGTSSHYVEYIYIYSTGAWTASYYFDTKVFRYLLPPMRACYASIYL